MLRLEIEIMTEVHQDGQTEEIGFGLRLMGQRGTTATEKAAMDALTPRVKEAISSAISDLNNAGTISVQSAPKEIIVPEMSISPEMLARFRRDGGRGNGKQ